VDPDLLQALLAAAAGFAIGGGGALAWHFSDRIQRREPIVPAPALPAGVTTVLSVLRSSAVVVDDQDVVLKASAPAYAFGLVHGNGIRDEELADLIRQVRRDGQIREAEFELAMGTRNQIRHVTARVAPLGSRLVLALLDDRTRERRVDSIRRDFVANVSHELKTPVGAIKLLSEAVHDASDDPEAVERFAGRMLKESDRLTHLVQQIIDLSRLQGDEPVAQPEAVPVDDIVAVAIDTSAIDAQAKGISVVRGGEEGLFLGGSKDQLTVAVSNLVANAVHYSREGAQVVVTARGLEETIEISVTDQGIGIPAGDLDRIFERFYRVDPARHRSTGGTGLGLSIVKHVAATHGGEIKVWSVEGQGSTFTLTLPRSVPFHQEESS
jgi:two-component system sensor histidine kinase SenX3